MTIESKANGRNVISADKIAAAVYTVRLATESDHDKEWIWGPDGKAYAVIDKRLAR